MASFNQVILIGNLTRDPELRVTPRGTSICQFGIAVNRTFKDESGNSKEEVNFFDIEAWGKQGEVISKFMSKGRPIFVQGRLKQDSWEDKATGQKRNKIKIVLENFQFIGSRDGGGQQGGGSGEENFDQASPVERNSPPPRPPVRNNPPPAQDNIDEDVPF
ncbi:single-strand DNA-binding protein [Ereboglobus sp. PH5-5]|uniref:single-stranded DNA-binding protein n=1 Tax=unclassified Ereboglobus TaxID=2626932 RepID=UPI0024068485|nr:MULTISPECIES: single-stranded DNA-binding protein [unclassified Ereboglobus]MDF9828031.1 single-strand DNA-binding protein [Ereboglobus sp. PH5-10]MDF9832275.1 single-strand DNA-binding protein [Ereboglobus sp. PH5-5]